MSHRVLRQSLAILWLLCAGVALTAAVADESRPVVPTDPGPQFSARLEGWLAEYGKEPKDYVIGLFANHDVVFLGEWHRIKQDPELIQSLLAPLYAVGVKALATEFARREDQALIDSLITDTEWHEELARQITFNNRVSWGYREYVDIYRAAWDINRARADGAPPFRVLAMNDSPDWSLATKAEDLQNPEILRKIWRGAGEQHWARVILDETDAGRKVLVYSGIHHAFTEYRQPIVEGGQFSGFAGERAGNYVFDAIGKRAITVFLHSPWTGYNGYEGENVHPADGALDAFMLNRIGGPFAVGFSLKDSPFGQLRVQNTVYRQGYENEFTPARYADGWIYTRPISKYEGVSPIADWINAANIETARRQMPNPDFRTESIENFNAGIAQDAEISRRLSGLH